MCTITFTIYIFILLQDDREVILTRDYFVPQGMYGDFCSIFGGQNWRTRYQWHLVGRVQGCC